MERYAAPIAVAVWFVLVGCIVGSGEPYDGPAPDYEGCSNDHDEFWDPAENGDVEIHVDSGRADKACNEALFHFRSGQGDDRFHIEPVLRLAGDRANRLTSVTWEVYDLDDPDDALFTQGIEVYRGDLQLVDGVAEHQRNVFVSARERGKNLLLVATTDLPSQEDEDTPLQARAAVYLGGAP